MFKINNSDTRTTSDVVMVSLLLTLNIFYAFCSIAFDDFKQLSFCWVP